MNNYIIAIELGSSKIVGIAGCRDSSGTLVVSAIESVSVENDAIKRGRVQNISEVSSKVQRVKKSLENRLHPAKILKTYVGVAGISVLAIDQVASHHFHEDSIIKQSDVAALKDNCISLLPSSLDCLEIVPVGYVVDSRPVNQAVGYTGTTIEGYYKAVMAHPSLKRNIDRCIVERLGLSIAGYVPAALSTAKVVLSDNDCLLGCVLVDFGAETTTVSVYKNGSLAHIATLPIGGRNITRDIMSLNVISSDAEDLKKRWSVAKDTTGNPNMRLTIGGANAIEVDQSKLASVVEARSKEIIANVAEQIKLSGIDKKDLTAGVVVLGGAAKLRGWVELLEERLEMKVRLATISKSIKVVKKEHSHFAEYLQAVGLLYAGSECCVQCQEDDQEQEPVVVVDEQDNSTNGDVNVVSDDSGDTQVREKKRKFNIISNIADKFNKFLAEGEDDGDNDEK